MSSIWDEQIWGSGRPWDRYLDEAERAVLEQSGYGARQGFGLRPCLVVVDVTKGFVGASEARVEVSNLEWPDSCGDLGWTSVRRIQELLSRARRARIPVIFTKGREPTADPIGSGRWKDKNSRWLDEGRKGEATEIVPAVAPLESEMVISKSRPSAFFGTPLLSVLIYFGVDQIVLCGATTSGCVRATAVDAFSLNYRLCVVEECTFDRVTLSHAVALMDINLKYGDVVTMDVVTAYLDEFSAGYSQAGF